MKFDLHKRLPLGACACVAGLSLSLSAQALGPPVAGLNVASHNVYLIPLGQSALGLAAPAMDTRAELIARADYMRDHDIAILNELFDASAADKLLDGLADQYPYRTPVVGRDLAYGSDCNGNDCWSWTDAKTSVEQVLNGGVAILSRWPIVERGQYVFRARCGADALARKGFAYARIDVQGEIVHVVATHLQAGNEDCSVTQRAAQVREIRNWIVSKNIPRTDVLLIGGDLNFDRSEDGRCDGTQANTEYCRMLATLAVDPPAYLGHRWTTDHDANQLNERDGGSGYLDYLLLSRNHRQLAGWSNLALPVCSPESYTAELDWGFAAYREYSDHYPVVAAASAAELTALYDGRDESCTTWEEPEPLAYGRGVGSPMVCAATEDYQAGLCYPKCSSGYSGVGPVCWKSCPAGFADDGAFCRKASYGRGVGTPLTCASNEQQGGALCYPRCRSGYSGVGPVCWQGCRSGYSDHGATCYKNLFDWYFKDSYGRGAGKPLHTCPSGKQKDGALCYPTCRQGYQGVGPVCWGGCPSGFSDIGVSCAKPSYGRGVGLPVHNCPAAMEKDAGLCYQPCDAGYTGVGPVCWRD